MIRMGRTNNSLLLRDKHSSRVEINNFLNCRFFIQGTHTSSWQRQLLTFLCELVPNLVSRHQPCHITCCTVLLLCLRRDSYNHFTSMLLAVSNFFYHFFWPCQHLKLGSFSLKSCVLPMVTCLTSRGTCQHDHDV